MVTIKVNNDEPIIEPTAEMTLYEGEDFRLISKPFRNKGNYLFVESVSGDDVRVCVYLEREGGNFNSCGYSNRNDGRMVSLNHVTSVRPFSLLSSDGIEYLKITSIQINDE